MFRTTTGKFVTVALYGLMSILAAELACRYVLFPEYTAMQTEMYTKHTVLRYYNRPNLTARRYKPGNYDVINRTNALGMRGPGENLEAQLRGVWIAGSSNTFGGYVEDQEVFSAVLRKQGIAAANLASEGHNLLDQVKLIRYLATRGYRPQAVILVPPVFHSIKDYSEDWGVLTAPLKTRDKTNSGSRPRDGLRSAVTNLWNAVPTSFVSVRARLIKSSALYGLLKVGIMRADFLREWTKRVGLRADIDLVYKFSLDLLRPMRPGNPVVKQIRSTAEFISAIQDLVHARFQVPFGVVLLPTRHQLYPESFGRFTNHFGLQEQDLDASRPLDALAEALRQRNVRVLNTLPAMREFNDRPLTFPDDGHLNARGHAIVGDLIAQWLSTEFGL